MNYETIKEQLHSLYIYPNPYRVWAWIFTVCVVLMFPKGTRRMGALGLFGGIAIMGIYFWLTAAFLQYMPDPNPPHLKVFPWHDF